MCSETFTGRRSVKRELFGDTNTPLHVYNIEDLDKHPTLLVGKICDKNRTNCGFCGKSTKIGVYDVMGY